MSKKLFFQACLLALGAMAVAGSGFWHQAHGDGHDFLAYYKAAQRLVAGAPFYVFEGGYAFKYAPLTVFYFVPFLMFEYNTARWVFTCCHILSFISVPFLLWKLVRSDSWLRGKVSGDVFVGALAIGFVGAFRFVDAELRASNVGAVLAVSLLLGGLLLQFRRGRFFVPALVGLGAVIKVHSLVAYFAFRFWEKKTFWAIAGAVCFFILFPNPAYWGDWLEQMRNTQGAMPLSTGNHNLQGFQSFAERFLGWDPHSWRSGLLAIPFFAGAAWALPRFSLDQAAGRPVAFVLTAGVWVLLALMCSPLPWQHTYSLLWTLLPLSWCCASATEKKLLFVFVLLLGLTPRDIAGSVLFSFLEGNQSVFLLVLAVWSVVAFQLFRQRNNNAGA